MSRVNETSYKAQTEQMNASHSNRLKRNAQKLRRELEGVKDQSQATKVQIEKEYEKKIFTTKTQFEQKLKNVREKNNAVIEKENESFERTLAEIKATHQEQINEMKRSQEQEISDQKIEHEDYIARANDRFNASKIKLEA